MIRGQKEFIENEKNTLAIYAAKSNCEFLTQRLTKEDDNSDIRLTFQRDRDRIIHSRAFRRLMHKTQVFNSNKGDHYRNRLTHTLEVSQIARSIGKRLGLNDELIEAISLGHDLGHTPFGHIGERTLHNIVHGNIKEIDLNNNYYGGFKHNFQSLHIIDNIEIISDKYTGLNLTLAVREGIIKHTKSEIKINDKKEDVKYDSLNLNNIIINKPSMTLEGQVVAISDEIAQCTHDLEDGIRAGILNMSNIKNNTFIKRISNDINKPIDLNSLKEPYQIRNTLIKNMVCYLIDNVCLASNERLNSISIYPKFKNINDVFNKKLISFSDSKELNICEEIDELSLLITSLVISSQEVSQSDVKAEYFIKNLYKSYFNYPQQLPDYILNRYFKSHGMELERINLQSITHKLKKEKEFQRLICDHIACMTDQYAAREYKKLYEPEHF